MGMYERQLLGYDGKLLTIGGKLLRLFATGLYTFDEVNTMITTQDYIPVASADELKLIASASTNTMGMGSPWEGSYITGTDKKYIQVDNIDFNELSTSWGLTMLSISAGGIYDGNALNIRNLNTDWYFFYSNMGIIKNINIINFNNTASAGNVARGLFIASNGGTINNIHVSGSVSGSFGAGGLAGYNGGTIKDSTANVTMYLTRGLSGGFVGDNSTNGLIENCSCISSMTAGGGLVFVGGFVGQNSTSTSQIKKCSVETTITRTGTSTNDRGWGGFAGGSYNNALIENCYVQGSIQGYARVGGFTGQAGAGGSRHTNCYAAVAVSGTTGGVGGFAGNNGGGTHVTTNSYFDSDVAGTTTTIFGLARTTLQMKEGTEDSFILPAGGTDPDSLAANAMYTSWDDVDTWDFGTTSEYPTLK